MDRRAWTGIVVVLAALLPLTGAGATDTTGCRVNTYAAVEVDGFYMYGTAKEFWQESNGLPGLQRATSYCLNKPSIPADTCVLHSETWAAIDCAAVYSGSLSP